jgi:hypothetical protein
MATVSDAPPRESTVDDLSKLQSRQAPPGGDKPPPRTPPRTPPTGSGAGGRTTAADKMELKLAEFFATIGLVTSAFNQVDGFIIVENSKSLAMSWTALAQENPTVKRAINGLLETGAWSAALMASAAVVIPILDNHGYIPARFSQFVPSAPPGAQGSPASDLG